MRAISKSSRAYLTLMNKRLIIIIVGGLVILAALGGALAWAVKKQNSKNSAPVAIVPQIKKVVDESVISPVPATATQGLWYFNSAGQLFRINLDGTGLTEFPLPAPGDGTVKKVSWPKSGSDFIMVKSAGTGETKIYYDSIRKIYVNLPANIQSFDWLPDNHRIAYIWQSGDGQHPAGGEARPDQSGRQQLALANADATGFTTIKEVFWPDLQVKVSPDGKTALLYRSQIDGSLNKIYAVNLVTNEITTVVDQGKNLDALWISPSRFIFTQAFLTSYPKVYLYDLMAQKATDLDLNTTLDKIVMDNEGKVLYAAEPKKDNTGDTFVTEDLSSFKQADYFTPDNPVRARNLMLIGNSLYFINNSDGKLYNIIK